MSERMSRSLENTFELYVLRTSIDDEGWTAEFAIPFSSISFDPNIDTWGINFERGIRRNDEDNRFQHAAVAAGLLSRIPEATASLRLPDALLAEAGPLVPLPQQARWYLNQAHDLACQFDQRNGNTYYRARLAEALELSGSELRPPQ